MNPRQRLLHWLLSPLALVLVSFALIFGLEEWRSAEMEAERKIVWAEQRAEEPSVQPPLPLFKAIGDKNPDAVRSAIALGADPNTPNDKGTLPVHYAFLKDGGWPGRRDVIEALLAGGADVNARMKSGYTALHLAANRADKEIIELLLERGADVNAKTKEGKTPLMNAERSEIVEFLLARGASLGEGIDPDGSYFIAAVRRGDEKLVELLIAKGVDPNGPKGRDHSPIKAAVAGGKSGVVQRLLAAGAHPDAKFSDGSALLHDSVRGNKIDVARLLIGAGADVNVASASGWTPLHVASALCHEDLVALLLASGANPDARDKHGKAPLPCYAFARKPRRDAPMQIASCR